MNREGVEHTIQVLEKGPAKSVGRTIECVLGEDLRFNRGALERCSSTPLEEIDVDLLVVLASIAFADRRVSRRSGKRWGRSLALIVPVYLAPAWEAVTPLLVSLLHEVTGDTWRFEFRRRRSDTEFRQLFLPQLPREFGGATVMPFSGGLDSFSTMVRHRLEHRETPLLLVHSKQSGRSLRAVLPERGDSAPALAVPFNVSGQPHAEPSYRTRTLIFFALAALAWRRTNATRIWIGESGVGCLGPALVPFGIEEPVRGCHPVFIKKLEELFWRLWGARPPFELPHLWLTKGEVIADLVGRGAASTWTQTHSCSRNVRRQHPTATASHCGLCSGCMFRRQSLRAAGIGEETGTYFADVTLEPELPADVQPADREVAIYAVIALDELAGSAERLSRRSGHVLETAKALGLPEADVSVSITRLLRRHSQEWRSFLDAVPARSWLRQVVFSHQGSG